MSDLIWVELEDEERILTLFEALTDLVTYNIIMEVNYSDSLKGYVLLRMSNTIAQFPDGYIADVKIIKNKSRDNFSHNTHYELNEVDVICGVGIKELAEKDYKILKEKIKEI